MPTEVEIDRDLCMGSGNCLYHAPGAFDLDDDGVAFVVDPEGVPFEQVENAAKLCPTGAITVRRGGESTA